MAETAAAGPRKPATGPKPPRAYLVVQEMGKNTDGYGDPARLFATKAAAQRYAAELNAAARELLNPFDGWDTEASTMTRTLAAAGVEPPAAGPNDFGYVDWHNWWARSHGTLTADQKAAVWAVRNRPVFKVVPVPFEG